MQHLLSRTRYKDCPRQMNGHDCGIFAVAVVLHLSECLPLNTDTFSQGGVTKARFLLAKAFASRSSLMEGTCDGFQSCFPHLSIAKANDLEIMTPLQLMVIKVRSTRSCPIVMEGRDGSSSEFAYMLPPTPTKLTKVELLTHAKRGKKQNKPVNNLQTTTATPATASLTAENVDGFFVKLQQAHHSVTPTTKSAEDITSSSISTSPSMIADLHNANEETSVSTQVTDNALYRIMEDH